MPSGIGPVILVGLSPRPLTRQGDYVSAISYDVLLSASRVGGATCLTSITELEPAAGPQASVAPAKFAAPRGSQGAYAYERRFLEGRAQPAVVIDSKQSQLNRVEAMLALAIENGQPTLSRMPRVLLHYTRDGVTEEYSDLTLPHRAFDGHIRAGTVDGIPVTQVPTYRAARDATPANARALLDLSPVSLIFGAWDSSRASRQGRWRSALVGEVIGFCDGDTPGMRGGARVDPVGMQVQLSEKDLRALADSQRAELSTKLYDKTVKEAAKAKGDKRVSASMLGLGGIPPTLETLAGVACHRIIRSHVLSFASLRQIRFGASEEGDQACRVLLAALALNGLARSDAELCLRANCDLREAGSTVVEIDRRGGASDRLDPLSIESADALLAEALERAEASADVRWNGVVLTVAGNPAIVAGAVAEDE